MVQCQFIKNIDGTNICCKYKSKANGFCGYHKNTLYSIIPPLNNNNLPSLNNNLPSLNNNLPSLNNNLPPLNNNSNETLNTTIITHKIDNKKLPTKKIFRGTKKDIIKELENYNINTNGSKENLYKKLINIKNTIDIFEKKPQILIKIQSLWRKFSIRNKIYYHGLCILNKTKCNNTADFCSMDNCNEIEDKYFFSYKDLDNFYYGFDIRSLKKLVTINKIRYNPYTRNDLSILDLDRINRLIKLLKYDNMEIDDGISTLTPQQKYNQRVISIFQKIDELNNYTNVNWFNNLTLHQLKYLYKEIEDIWNYRANLTIEQKKTIIPTGFIFSRSMKLIWSIKDINKIRNILLDDIDKLVSMGITEADKSLGALYFLTGMVIVSKECAQALPYLSQN